MATGSVLIIGGDKSGQPRFYARVVQQAKEIWKEYLAEQLTGKHEEE